MKASETSETLKYPKTRVFAPVKREYSEWRNPSESYGFLLRSHSKAVDLKRLLRSTLKG